MSTLKETSEWLRANTQNQGIGVDREQNAILGYVVAQEGPFKSAGRGAFDVRSLKKIVTLMNKQPAGLKSRLAHPTLSSDGIGKFLGRVKNGRMDSVKVRDKNGELKLLHAVRGDLFFDETAFDTPNGNLADYVMRLSESDPDALSSSLVLTTDQEEQIDQKTKKPKLDEEGNPLPPLWIPKALHASDVVDTGDAVDGLLSTLSPDGLPDELVRRGAELLDRAFPDASRQVLQARLLSWMDRYLEMRYGVESDGGLDVSAEGRREQPRGMSRGVAELYATLAERGVK